MASDAAVNRLLLSPDVASRCYNLQEILTLLQTSVCTNVEAVLSLFLSLDKAIIVSDVL